VVPSDPDTININDRVFGFGFSADQFITLLDRQDPFDLGKNGKGLERVMGAFVANRCNDRLKLSVDRVRGIPEFLNFLEYFFDLFVRRFRLEDDYHERIGANSTSGPAGELEKAIRLQRVQRIQVLPGASNTT
jgi:hypothetical protein